MLELRDIHKSYEGRPLLRGISFEVAGGETVCLLGASGSGKSTLLRIVAGLEQAEQGRVFWDDTDLAPLPAHARQFGLVFQDYALFPHFDVAENVAFGLKMKDLSSTEIRTRVAETLEKVNLGGFQKRRVTDLSGGEQQRVALARALAPHPRLLMFDEPLGALDRTLKDRLLEELRGILHESGVPAIYVTHDQEEAFSIADRLILLHEGRIVREGQPPDVWSRPGSGWAARFLGLGNVLEGSWLAGGRVRTEIGVLETACTTGAAVGESVAVLIRPEATGVGKNVLEGRVTDVLFHQRRFKVTLENGLFFLLDEAPQIGQALRVEVPQSAVECLAWTH